MMHPNLPRLFSGHRHLAVKCWRSIGQAILFSLWVLLAGSSIVSAQSSYQQHHTISGTLVLSGINPNFPLAVPIGSIAVRFVPVDGSPELSYQYLNNPGSFSFSVPAAVYKVGFEIHKWNDSIKVGKWLRKIVQVDLTTSDQAIGTISLEAGDATWDNMVDIGDFGLVVNAYGSSNSDPGSNYDDSCDFNCDGLVDIGDFGLVVNSYGDIGDSFTTLSWGIPLNAPDNRLFITGGDAPLSYKLTLTDLPSWAAQGAPPTLRCSLDNAMALSGATANSGSVTPLGPGSAVSVQWDHDPYNNNQLTNTCTFHLLSSTVNYPTFVTVTATYSDPDNGLDANANLYVCLLPTNLWANYVRMPNVVNLQWDSDSSSGFFLMRDGNFVAYYTPDKHMANDAILNSSGDPIANFGDGNTTYTYELWAQADAVNNYPAHLLATEKVTPLKIGSIENQAVDSRWDLRYSDIHYLDFWFGTRSYRGGLFAGYAAGPGDSSRIGRSFGKFNLSTPLPTGTTLRSGTVNSFFTQATVEGSVYVLCYALNSSDWSALGTGTGGNGALVWTNSLSLMSDAFPGTGLYPPPDDTSPSAVKPVHIYYTPPDPNAPADPFLVGKWAAWDLSESIRTAQQNATDHRLSVAWTGGWDVSDNATPPSNTQWAYFAKNEYGDHAHGPCLLYTLSHPTPVQILFDPPSLTVEGTITCTVVMNGVGVGDSVPVEITVTPNALTTDVSFPGFNNGIFDSATSFSLNVTGFSKSFKMHVSTPAGYTNPNPPYDYIPGPGGTVEVRASLNGVTVTKTLQIIGN